VPKFPVPFGTQNRFSNKTNKVDIKFFIKYNKVPKIYYKSIIEKKEVRGVK